MIESIEKMSSVKQIENRDDWIAIETTVEDLQSILSYMFEHLEFRYLHDVFVNEKGEQKILHYVIQNFSKNILFDIYCEINPQIMVPSNSHLWINCFYKEILCKEKFNIGFDFQYGSPSYGTFRKDIDETILVENKNILLKQNIKCFFKVKNNFVEDVHIENSFVQKNFESFLAGKNSQDTLLNLFKLNYKRAFAIETLWCEKLERINQLKLTDKAIALRMLFLELERVTDHLNFFIGMGEEMSYTVFEKHMLSLKKQIQRIKKNYTGNSTHVVLNCVGGIRFDVPRNWVSQSISILEMVKSSFVKFMNLIETSSLWKKRLECGKIDANFALLMGLSGPNLRACGVNYDTRKNSPYYFYGDLDFDVPVGQTGRTLDRFLVRKEEVLQSFNIIIQILDNIPTGKITTGDFNYFRSDFYGQQIDKTQFEKSALEKVKIPEDNQLQLFEGSNGLMGIFASGDSEGNVDQFRFFSSDQSALEIFKSSVIGNDFDDALLIYSSLNICLSEVEK